MARVVVLGAGVSGHTAALHLRRVLPSGHEVVVVSPHADWNWIPSNIWVGVGRMGAAQVTFALAPVYRRMGVEFRQARAVAVHPHGDRAEARPAVDLVHTTADRQGETERLRYDYLVVATGPKLNFAATPGLGPAANSWSVCTAEHAVEAAEALSREISEMRSGRRRRLVIGMGHGMCTCEGAAFEYTFNVEHELRRAGVRDLAEIVYLSNEAELGDFGVGGMTLTQQGFETSSRLWTESLFRERGVTAVLGAHVQRVDPGRLTYLTLAGVRQELTFDFAMLLPPFQGQGLEAFDRDGADVTSQMFSPTGFLKVDADYSGKPYDRWSPDDWPKTCQSPYVPNVFGVGIAFAPPHPISRPRTAPDGTVITPAPPRTGMPSGMMGRQVAMTVRDMLLHGAQEPTHHASMASMGSACVASAGSGLRQGSAAAMTMYPIVPDPGTYPAGGRSGPDTYGELGLAGHWIKHMLHHMFIYKAKAMPGWQLIPE